MSTILVMKFFFWLESNYVFISYQKLPLVFSLTNTPYFNFLTKDGRVTNIYTSLLLRPCTLFALKTSKKPLWILYQISKLYLNLV